MERFRYFDVEQHDAAIVATIVEPQLHGEAMAELLRHELFEVIDRFSPKVVVVDFSNVKMISTSIVSSLLRINQGLSGKGIQFRLAAMNPSLHSIFKTLRLEMVFLIYDATAEALAGPSGPVTFEDVVGRPTPFDPDESDS